MPDWVSFNYYHLRLNLFTKAQCDWIIDQYKQAPEYQSVLHHGNGQEIRNSYLTWLFPTVENQWVFDQFKTVGTWANSFYDFDVNPQPSSLQLTRYTPGQKYDWHMDVGGGTMSHRKLSIVVALNEDFEGGGLDIFHGDFTPDLKLRTGDAVIFPSFIMHRAKPVISGERWSLVTWLTGTEHLK